MHTDMTAQPVTQTLREAHKSLTRHRILEAALGLMRTGAPDALTIAAVAAAAGVTERTIYRHFAAREDLLQAVWERINANVSNPVFPAGAADLIRQPRRVFPQFDLEEGLIRAIATTREGRELRLSVNAGRQEAMRAAVREAWPDLAEPHFTRLCAVVQLLDSSFAWVTMKDYWGLDGAEAGKAASQAIAALLRAAPDFAAADALMEENKP